MQRVYVGRLVTKCIVGPVIMMATMCLLMVPGCPQPMADSPAPFLPKDHPQPYRANSRMGHSAAFDKQGDCSRTGYCTGGVDNKKGDHTSWPMKRSNVDDKQGHHIANGDRASGVDNKKRNHAAVASARTSTSSSSAVSSLLYAAFRIMLSLCR